MTVVNVVSRANARVLSWHQRLLASLGNLTAAYVGAALLVHSLILVFRAWMPLCGLYILHSLHLFYHHLPSPFLSLLTSSSLWPAIADTPVPFYLPTIIHMVVFTYCCVEIIFYFYTHRRALALQHRRAPPPLSKDYREIFIRRVLIAICKLAEHDALAALVHDGKLVHKEGEKHEGNGKDTHTDILDGPSFPLPRRTRPPLRRQLSVSPGNFDPRKILRGWFFNAPIESIYEDNIIQWLCFGLFHRDWKEMTRDQQQEIQQLWQFLLRGGRSSEELDLEKVIKQNSLFYSSEQSLDRANSVNTIQFIHSPSVSNGSSTGQSSPSPPPIQRSYSTVSAQSVTADALPPPSTVTITPGFNKAVKAMRVVIDKVRWTHRPLFLYSIVMVGHELFSMLCKYRGYQYYNSNGFCYWHRPPLTSTSKHLPPVIFVHGISNGVSSYSAFLYRFKDYSDRHLFFLHLPYIAMRIHDTVPTAKETVTSMKSMLDRHCGADYVRNNKILLIGHSYGSLLCSWFVKSYPSLIRSIVLIDPVCFVLFLPHLCYNFLYRKPSSPMHYMLDFFVAKELYISHTLHRHFFWPVNILWVEDLTYIGIDEVACEESEAETREERQHGENWDENPNRDTEDGREDNDSRLRSRSRSRSDSGARQLPPAASLTPSARKSSSVCNTTIGTVKQRKRNTSNQSLNVPDKESGESEEQSEMIGPELLLNAVISPLIRAPRSVGGPPRHSPRSSSPTPAHRSMPQASRCYVFLSEDDDIVYAPPIKEYLVSSAMQLAETEVETRWREQRLSARSRKHKAELARDIAHSIVQVTMWKKYRHAQFLISTRAQLEVMAAIDAVSNLDNDSDD